MAGAAAGIPWQALVLLLAGAVAYVNTLSNPFVFDDEGSVLSNESIRRFWSSAVLMPERELPVSGRPVVNLTFAINYAIGGFDVTGYRLVNLAIHLVCAVLLFAVARLLLQPVARDVPLIRGPTPLAFAIALLWTLHPLNSEAVSYLTQRTESLMAAFYLLTVYASLRSIPAEARRWWPAVAVAACALGMASKESMVTAPVIVVLIDRTFFFGSFAAAFRARGRLYAALAGTWVVLVLLQSTDPRPGSAGFEAGVSAWTYLLNQAPIIVRYLRLSVWPTSLVANYGWPEPLTLSDVALPMLGVAGLAAATVAALRRYPALGFLGAWFFITLAPASSIVPVATEVGAERRMYLPLAAVIALAVVGAARVWPRPAARQPAAVLAALALVLGGLTIARNREYSTGVRLAEVTLDRYPTPSTRHVLAEHLLLEGRRDEAIVQLRAAIPDAPRAHYTLGVELYRNGQVHEAIEQLEAFIQRQPTLVWVTQAYGVLGQAYQAQGNLSAAIDAYQTLLTLSPGHAAAVAALADLLNDAGTERAAANQLTAATEAFRQAVALDPRHGPARHNLALALCKQGDLAEAVRQARDAAALQPEDADTRTLLEYLLAAQTQFGTSGVPLNLC